MHCLLLFALGTPGTAAASPLADARAALAAGDAEKALEHLQAPAGALADYRALLRGEVPFYDKDRYFAPDIEKAMTVISSGVLLDFLHAPCRL